MGSIDWFVIISIAFAGSFGHCIGMCGGFIVAYSSTKIDASMSRGAQLLRHGAYNIGRVSSYAILGMIFGGLGSLFTVSMEMHGALFIFAGILMIITALSMLGLSKLLHALEHSFSNFKIFKLLFSRLIKSKSIKSFFALGMMNGFFPCGFVFFFAAKAASSASILHGGAIMAIFGLATIPTLLALGQSVNFMREIAFRQSMNRLAAIAIAIYGLYSIYYGLAYFIDLPM
ncbi:MAG: sulfite exporter TauE/SafE family protein [Sulfuricurvum sp.]|uniref:sulfite exporter TauE/SafE family protein n=1 Tax=Sulfuricurvum sp. TaxID=2025608 RepID=UPI002617F546|nr:sulfite exporter TauE/SafE family protein [Sulfuricurvum sp.]MDD2828374.1 sulfite exporter TauE/SafE family protein [Sulfuricurvum sp.]MDD4949379.1 sulfite exporter TauE/SafE family protein [Sulfuricurvum sp.]